MGVRELTIAFAAAGVLLAAAGCSGSSSSGSGGSGSSGSGSTASASSTASGSAAGTGSTGQKPGGSGGQLTGAELTRALLPAKDFPSSFARSQQGSADSGTSLEKAAASYNLSTMSCSDWDNYFTSSGFGETAYSSGSVASHTTGQTYGQVVYQFSAPSAASQFFSGVRALSNRCRSYTASGGGAADRVTMQTKTASPLEGHQTFWIDQATSVSGATSKINTLFALDGTDVFAVSASGVGTAPPANPDPTALVPKLIASVLG